MTSGNSATITATPFTTSYNNVPSRLLINISTTNASWANQAQGSILIAGSGWNASVNVTPDISDCLNTSGNNVTILGNCNGADLTVTVMKNSVATLNRAVVYSNISPTTPYSVDLMDAAYGIQSLITSSSSLTFSKYDLNSLTTATVTPQYAYQTQQPYAYSVPLGALVYTASNKYWIPQTYYYQMGGVFLLQSDGITYKLPPDITFKNNGNGNITVNIVALAIDPADTGAIGGSSPAQVSAFLEPSSGNLTTLAPVSPNTWSTNISISTPDPYAATMWGNYLELSGKRDGWHPEDLLYR